MQNAESGGKSLTSAKPFCCLSDALPSNMNAINLTCGTTTTTKKVLRKKNEFRVEKQALDNWHRRYTQRDFWDSNHGVYSIPSVWLLQ